MSNLTYAKYSRDLDIRATITYANGITSLSLDTNDIVSYDYDRSIGSNGLPLGGTESASFTLVIYNRDKNGNKYSVGQFDHATVYCEIGIKNDGETSYTYTPFGKWYVESVSMPEQDVTVTLTGYDALATKFDKKLNDTSAIYPTAIGELVRLVCAAAGVVWSLDNRAFPQAAVKVTKQPEWNEDTTIRDILSYCAICAGGYAIINTEGELEVRSFLDANEFQIPADYYTTFTLDASSTFTFNSLEVYTKKDAVDYTRYAFDSAVVDNQNNTIQLDYNPLLADGILKTADGKKVDVPQTLVSRLHGFTALGGELTWIGDPSVECGDIVGVHDTSNGSYDLLVLSESFSFEGGLSCTITSSMPNLNGNSSANYSTTASLFNSDGDLNVTRISGLDERVISATSGYIGKLTADTITTDLLFANLIKALNLTANQIDAKVIFVDQTKITGDMIDTWNVYAKYIKSGTITAEQLNTTSMEASYAHITRGDIDNATIGYAKILGGKAENLFIYDGNGDNYYFKKLRVTSAQIMEIMVGRFVFKGDDGKFYELHASADASGNVKLMPTEYEGTVDIETGTATYDGEQKTLFEDTVNVKDLTAGDAHISNGIVTRLYASELCANEAFISKLATTEITSTGDTITLIAERSTSASTVAAGAQALAQAAQTTAESAQSAADDAMEVAEEVQNYMEITPSGVYVKDENQSSVLKLTSGAVEIGNNGTGGYAKFDSQSLQFGNYELRMSADGGLVFKMKE